MSLKYSLKNRRKLLALLAISLFIGSIYTPVFLFSQTSNNYLTNLLILDGKIKPRINHNLQKQGQSWLSGWGYRKSHTIVGSTAGAQTNYQMKIVIHYGNGTDSGENAYFNAHCKNDFGDIRFTKSDGTTLLDYWMEEKTDGYKATFWVEIDYIPTSPETVDIYIYYGNNVAETTSNGDNTFILFDHFDDGILTGWNTYGTVSESGTSIKATGQSGTQTRAVSTSGYNLENKRILTRSRIVPGKTIDKCNFILIDSDSGGNGGNSIQGWRDHAVNDDRNSTHFLAHETYGVSNTVLTETISQQAGTYNIYEIIRKSAGTEWLSDGISYATSNNDPNVNEYIVPVRTWGESNSYEVECDWVFVAKWANPEPTHGSWGIEKSMWLSGWSYRKLHTIIGSTAGVLANYQMKITVHYGSGTDNGTDVYCNSKCRTDFGDIRFTKSDGTTLLDYWMEEKHDSDNATFWVEVDNISSSPSTVDIYVYYGKSDANTISNGGNTFPFFDHFLGTSLDDTKWGVWQSGGYVNYEVADSKLHCTSTGDYQYIYTDNKVCGSPPFAVTFKGWNVVKVGSNLIRASDAQTSFTDGSQSRYYDLTVGGGGTDRFDFIIKYGGTTVDAWYEDVSPPQTWTTEHLVDSNGYVEFIRDGSSKGTSTNTIPTSISYYLQLFIHGNRGDSEWYLDAVWVRNYCDPEPTHGAWGNEEQLVIWNDTTITDTQIVKNKYIILNGNLTIASGGSLTLTDVILRVNCTLNGSNRIEVQNGGVLYINDTDGNPNTRSDATIVTAHNPSYRYLFWVKSGAIFQINNSLLQYCGYHEGYTSQFEYFGLWINTNNTIIENNTFTNNFFGIVLYEAHHNTIKNNNVSNSGDQAIHLRFSTHNDLSGNTVENNRYGFFLNVSSNNNLLNNIATDNGRDGFCLFTGSSNNLTKNRAINNNYGFYLSFSSQNNVTGNIAINNTNGFYLDNGSSGNNLMGCVLANYLRIEVQGYFDGPIPDADIKIEVNGNPIYGSPGFGGSNSTTDQNGLTDWIVVPYRTFISGAWMDNTTNVTVSFFELTIPNNPREVNMSSSHTETFVVEMIETTFTIDIVAGPDKYVDASAQTGVELILNITAPVKLSIIKTINTLGGGAPSGLNFLGRFVCIEVNDTIAIQGIRIIMHYTDQEVSGINLDENSIAIWYWNEAPGNWIQLESYINTVNNLVAANTTHLTHFALLGSLMPSEPPISLFPPYLLYMLYYLFTPSGINPSALFLVISWVALALIVLGIALWRRREEEAALEIRAPAQISSDQLRPAQKWIASARNIRCSLCGADIPKNSNFCIYCGGAISRCSVCNLEIVSGDRIVSCPHCGAQSHRDHLLEWIKVRGYCPNCKKRLSQLDVF